MAADLNIQGTWPAPLHISRSWAVARARTWNDDTPEAFIRLVRGSAAFLRDTSEHLARLTGADVLSPVVLGSSERVWHRSGYERQFALDLMERSLTRPWLAPSAAISQESISTIDRIVPIDQAAFEPFWRMSPDGMREAVQSTQKAVILTVADEEDDLAGYAVVGSQWSTAYLQRIAVHPRSAGRGLGSQLIRAALSWAKRVGAAAMLLNVRPANTRAAHLYSNEGFVKTQSPAYVYRYAA